MLWLLVSIITSLPSSAWWTVTSQDGELAVRFPDEPAFELLTREVGGLTLEIEVHELAHEGSVFLATFLTCQEETLDGELTPHAWRALTSSLDDTLIKLGMKVLGHQGVPFLHGGRSSIVEYNSGRWEILTDSGLHRGKLCLLLVMCPENETMSSGGLYFVRSLHGLDSGKPVALERPN